MYHRQDQFSWTRGCCHRICCCLTCDQPYTKASPGYLTMSNTMSLQSTAQPATDYRLLLHVSMLAVSIVLQTKAIRRFVITEKAPTRAFS